MNKPVIFSDLDDTLFQTRRKMVDELDQTPFRCGALDRSHEPRSFMTEEQAMLVDWMLASAELIPVTARGSEELSRVQIPFTSWAIATHGAVILNPQGEADAQWRGLMLDRLQPYRAQLLDMQAAISALMAERGVNGWARINYEYNQTPVYLVMKHRDSTRLDELYAIADDVARRFPLSGYYQHRNSNNVAWLPQVVEKGLAVSWLLDKLRAERGTFPVIGLGDSLSDHLFMKLCSWYGLPRQCQFATAINQTLFGDAHDA